jgi:hypothetical protein
MEASVTGRETDRKRAGVLLSGLAGLAATTLLAGAAAWLVGSGRLKAPLPLTAVALLFAVVFGAISLAEIPIMVFAMRRLLVERRGNRRLVLGLNALYVSFAAVYALPVFLLSGHLPLGWALSGLALARFASSLLFVREGDREPAA